MSLVNDALNQLPDKSTSSDILINPYGNSDRKKKLPLSKILSGILILIIFTQIVFLVVTGKIEPLFSSTETESIPQHVDLEVIKPENKAMPEVVTVVVSGPDDFQVDESLNQPLPIIDRDEPELIIATEELIEELTEIIQPELNSDLVAEHSQITTSNGSQDTPPVLAMKGDSIIQKSLPSSVFANKSSSIVEIKLEQPEKEENTVSRSSEDKPPNEIPQQEKSLTIIKEETIDTQGIVQSVAYALEQGDVLQAESILIKALDSEPDNKIVRLSFSKYWLRQSRYEKALAVLDNQSFSEAVALKAMVYELMDQPDIALDHYEQLVSINSLPSGYQLRYAVLLENKGNLGSAKRWYQIYAQNQENDSVLRSFAAERYYLLNEGG